MTIENQDSDNVAVIAKTAREAVEAVVQWQLAGFWLRLFDTKDTSDDIEGNEVRIYFSRRTDAVGMG